MPPTKINKKLGGYLRQSIHGARQTKKKQKGLAFNSAVNPDLILLMKNEIRELGIGSNNAKRKIH